VAFATTAPQQMGLRKVAFTTTAPLASVLQQWGSHNFFATTGPQQMGFSQVFLQQWGSYNFFCNNSPSTMRAQFILRWGICGPSTKGLSLYYVGKSVGPQQMGLKKVAFATTAPQQMGLSQVFLQQLVY